MTPPLSKLHDWRKSSYSGTHTNCVECASTAWHTASYSSGANNCVEVAEDPRTAIRDSKHPQHATLSFGAREWSAFLTAAKNETL